MFFRQLFDSESSTYTYLLADESTREAVIIDPVKEHVAEYLDLLARENLRLKHVLDTHVHADHVTGAGELRAETGAPTAMSEFSKAACVSLRLKDGDELAFGNNRLNTIHTPGHTPCSASYLVDGKVFTGDALLIDGCGRTDFQGGSAERLWDSITKKLFTLPPDTLVYPGHDYKGREVSTIGEEMKTNARLAGKTREQFIKIMNELDLPQPKRIQEAVPANEKCGLEEA
jgi:glyoxylase-like metal-dependent hydrolase (beta-lactamase superfamily II)